MPLLKYINAGLLGPGGSSSTIVDDYLSLIRADGASGMWRLNELTGTVAADSSGNSLDGTYINSPTLGASGAISRDPNTAVSFDGALSQYISVPDAALLDPGNTFSLECWTMPTAFASFQNILTKGVGGYQFGILSSSPGVFFLAKQGIDFIVQSTAPVVAGVWSHIMAVKSGASFSKLYLNGVDVSGTVSDLTIVATTDDLNMARSTAGNNYFTGSLDEIAIYPTALTGAQVLAHYISGNGVGGSWVIKRRRRR